MNKDLFKAILAMDSYNRGYSSKIDGLSNNVDTKIGNATISSDSSVFGSYAQEYGFYAISYTYEGENIISYRGTDSPLDIAGGWIAGIGVCLTPQAILAANFYESVIGNENPYSYSTKIEFVGHSLGGGLAGMMASIYSQEATVFDNMPFELAASSTYLESLINDDIKNTYYFNGVDQQSPDYSGVTAYATFGEALSYTRGTQSTPVTTLNSYSSKTNPIDLHSQALLVTLLYAKTEKEAGNLTEEWYNVAGSFIDALFDDDVAHSISSSLSTDQMLNKIAYSAIDEGTRVFGDVAIRALFNDANDLGKAVGVSNVSSIIDSLIDYDIQSAVSKMLVQFAGKLAQDKVLYSNNSQAIEGMLKLSSNSDSLTIKLSSTIWGASSPFEKSQMLNSLYNKFGITDASIMPSASDVENVVLSTTNNGSNYNGDLLENINGTNLLFGADGIDNISGSISKDIIFGGKGDDTLEGGAGNDTYIFNNTYNKDTITDSDNSGKIIINNQAVTGTATLINAENPGIYQLVIGVNVYSLTVSGSDLVIINQGDPENESVIQNQITVKNFSSGNLGITLSDVPDEGNGETPKINHMYVGTDGASFSINGNSLIYGNINNSNKNQKNFSNQNFQNLQKQKRSNKFVNLMICFLVIMFSISIPKQSYSMSFFASELEKKYKPLSLPTSVPFDITKKGNEVEAYIKVEKWAGYSFMLEFRYYDPRDDKNSKYYRNSLERAISEISMFKKYSRKYSKEELAEIFIDYNRVRNLVDHGELENGKFIQYAGIETPIHLIVTKINDDKSEKNIFDDISQTKKWGSGGATFHKIIFGYNQDNKKILLFPGIYRVKAIAEKDSPELVGTDIYLFMQESFYGK